LRWTCWRAERWAVHGAKHRDDELAQQQLGDRTRWYGHSDEGVNGFGYIWFNRHVCGHVNANVPNITTDCDTTAQATAYCHPQAQASTDRDAQAKTNLHTRRSELQSLGLQLHQRQLHLQPTRKLLQLLQLYQ
jgi:hypothetical protein